VTSRVPSSFSTAAPRGRGRIDENHEQIREFSGFLAREWRGSRHHSYTVPSRGKSSAWSRMIGGKWSAVGLADAVSKYSGSGKSFSENKAESDRFAADLQSAIQRDSNKDVCEILRAIMQWSGLDNKHRQKRTFEWIERNADEISVKLSNAVELIKDEQASLDPFDGVSEPTRSITSDVRLPMLLAELKADVLLRFWQNPLMTVRREQWPRLTIATNSVGMSC
jgi:hypothetical protein